MEIDFDKLQREQESTDDKRAALETAASIVSTFEDVPSSYQLLYGKGQNSKSGSEGLRRIAQTIKDPWDKQKKTYELYTAAKNNKKLDMDIAKEERRSDPNSDANKAYRANLKATFPQIVGKISPEQFEALTIEDGDSFLKPAQFAETIAARKQSAALAAQARNDAREQKREEKEASLTVPGFARTGEVLPKVEEAQKFRKAVATAEQLNTKLNRMKELVKNKGSFEYGGNAGTEMATLATEIQLLGKSPELYELGVLTGPDLSLLQKITADPASMDSLFTLDSSRQTQLNSQLASIANKLDSTGKSLGYVRAPKQIPAGGAQTTNNTASAAAAPVKKEYSKSQNKTRITYSDGSVELLDGRQ